MPFASKAARRAYQVAYAHRVKADIIAELGGCCALCGATDALTLDHVNPRTRTWSTRAKGLYGSALAYRKDFKAGLLQVLCAHDNSTKNARPWTEFLDLVRAREAESLAVMQQELSAG